MKLPFLKKSIKNENDNNWLYKFNIKTFIDIGAYKGEYIDFAQDNFPQATIYAFEPLKNMYKLLKKRETIYPKLKIYPYALADENRIGTMFKSSYPPSSSLLHMEKLHKINFPESRKQKQSRVKIRTLDSVMNLEKLDKNIFIKIDTQGLEDKIISGGKKTLKKTAILLIEVSFQRLYKGQNLFDETYTNLHDLGFLLSGFRNQIISPLNGSVLQAHAFFIHRKYNHLL